MKVGFELGRCLFRARVAVKICYPFRSFYVGSKEGNSTFFGWWAEQNRLPTLEGLHRRHIRCREFRKMWISGRQNGLPGGPNTASVVAISLVVVFVTISLLLMAVWYKRRQKRRNRRPNVNYIMPSPSASSQNSDSQFLRSQPSTHPLTASPSLSNSIYSPDHGGVGNSRAWFSYEELAEATEGFSGSNLLGEGPKDFHSFSETALKGLLADGREVAVKELKIAGSQGEREFRAEVEIISRVHHRHLVSLVGYCISEHQRFLVYQYVPNNTLHCHLHCEFCNF